MIAENVLKVLFYDNILEVNYSMLCNKNGK